MTNVFLRRHYKFRVNITSVISQVHQQLFIRQSTSLSLKVIYKMDEAYMRYEKGNSNFDLTFRYKNPDFNVDRQFNLSRKTSESIGLFLKRIDVNIDKVLSAKKKRKTKKNPEYQIEKKIDNIESGNIVLFKGNNKMDLETTCEKMLEDPTELSLLILGAEYKVKFNAPSILNIELPASLLTGFPVYPRIFEALCTDKAKSKFFWFRNEKLSEEKFDENRWEKIGEGHLYIPMTSDIGSKLKLRCLPMNDTEEGPEMEVISNSVVEAGPGICPFEARHAFTKTKLSGENFRLVSYNLLADTYADSDYSREVLFPYCPHYALNIDYRKLLIVKELIGYNSDIICLQEVDRKVYENDLMPSLSIFNFDGTFCTKGQGTEGLALLYDTKRFELMDHKCTIMSQNIESNDAFRHVWDKITNDETRQRFSNRNTSLLVVALRSKDNPKEIIVIGNTHLYFHPDADHIRLLQSYYALTTVRKTARGLREIFPDDNVSMMLCGDFNSTPVDGVYELMTKKHIAEDHKDWRSNAEQVIENVSLTIDETLASACGTPAYTNFTIDFADCLDYIFYETNKFEVKQIIPMPSKEELSLHGAIPSVVFPSDHIALCVDLKWISQIK